MFTQLTLNLLYDSAFSAYIYIYMNTNYNLVFNSAIAAYIYVYGNTSCNGTLTVNNAPTPNSSFTQLILNLAYDSASAVHMYINGHT